MSKLYELPDGWDIVEWEKILTIKNGKNYKEVLNENGKYPIYGSGGIINYANEYLCNENSVIIGRKGTINNPLFIREKFWNIDTAFGIESDIEKLLPKLLYYFCLNFNFLDLNKSTTLPSLAKSNLLKILMPLPPLKEQKRIVSKLDTIFEKIDKAIELHEKNIKEADAFMASVLNEVFEELEKKYGLSTLSNTVQTPKQDIVDGPFGSNLKASEYIDSGKPIVRLQNIQRFRFIDKEIKFVSEEKFEQLKRHTFIKDDVVITKLGDPLGKACIVPEFLEEGVIVADVIRARIDEKLSINKFVVFSINSQIAINQFLDSSKGATRQRVKLTMVRDLKFPLPPLNIQQKTVNYLDQVSTKIEKTKAIQKEKLQNLKDLKASLLDQAFKGKL